MLRARRKNPDAVRETTHFMITDPRQSAIAFNRAKVRHEGGRRVYSITLVPASSCRWCGCGVVVRETHLRAPVVWAVFDKTFSDRHHRTDEFLHAEKSPPKNRPPLKPKSLPFIASAGVL